MSSIVKLNDVLDLLKKGSLSGISRETIYIINVEAKRIIELQGALGRDDIIIMDLIIMISNILYNNTPIELLPLDDSMYDKLFTIHKQYHPSNFIVGAPVITFTDYNASEFKKNIVRIIPGLTPMEKKMTLEYEDELLMAPGYNHYNDIVNGLIYQRDLINTERKFKHEYPKLVGTLGKCKIVTCVEAERLGVLDDPHTDIFERDFFGKHIRDGILDPNRKFGMVLELKYDGLSVEATVSNRIISARTRGDTTNDLGADVTHILRNYRFPQAALTVNPNDTFGMKFEAIITHDNLVRYREDKNARYANCRSAITSIFTSLDDVDYCKYITLVPLATSMEDIDRITEINFMNTYYNNGVYLKYKVIYGNYIENLYQINQFVKEAEYMRDYLPFMYDGVVVSYLDEDIKTRLGRENSVNKYSMAIKFEPKTKNSRFRGYEYTVGQDGCITPMIKFDPLEFFGTIHDCETGHSYGRFKELGLKEGDIVTVTFRNDVMCYVSKDESIPENINNTNPVIEFIDRCPSCGEPITISESGKAAYCTNMNCPERNIARMVSMVKKLGIRDFSEETLKKICRFSFRELMSLTLDDVRFLGEINSYKLIEQLEKIKNTPIDDYKIIGSLGFDGIAIEKWKLIMNTITLSQLLMIDDDIRMKLYEIKGIGNNTVDTIVNELIYFLPDLVYIRDNMKLITKDDRCNKKGKIIRFTGFRDRELSDMLESLGHDANPDGSVTKATNILLIPYLGFTSTKLSKCSNTTLIVPVDEFRSNMDKYLSK